MLPTILISAGHADDDVGARGTDHDEADLTLDLRDRVIDALGEVKGHRVIRDGDAGQNQTLRDAIRLARSAVLAVEIHFNPDIPKAKGSECFGTERTRTLCQRLARACDRHLGGGLRGGDGGYKHHTDSARGTLGFCRAGGVVLEVCFINAASLAIYLPKRDALARSIAAVVREEVGAGSLLGAGAKASLSSLGDLDWPARARRMVAPGTRSERERALAAPHRRRRRRA